MKLLVVEDEPKLNQGLVQGLQSRGFVVDSALDGEEGERLARLNDYDLLILDIMLPKRTGLELCRNLRAVGKHVPVLFLTAKDTVPERVEGLEAGGDDYLVKPFAFDELVARIRSILRRPTQMQQEILTLDGLRFDPLAQRVTVDNKDIILTQREFALLEYLLRNKGNVVTRQDILDHVWDRFFDSFSNVVDVHLKNLRKKLPDAYAKRIKTIWGKGYRLS